MSIALWSLSLLGALAGPPTLTPFPGQGWPLVVSEEAQQLLGRWERGEPGAVLVLGDSLAHGLELAEPETDSYPALLVAMLQTRFRHPHLRLINEGRPGRTAADAWREWRTRRPARLPPDLVVIQFGGNDAGAGIPPAAYERSLRSLVSRLRREAPVVLIIPPMQYPEQQGYPQAARRVAVAEAVPAADFERLLKTPPCDARGPFPAGAHPRGPAHQRMALETYRVLMEWFGQRCHLQLQPPAWRGKPQTTVWPVVVRSGLARSQQGQVRWRVGARAGQEPVRLPPYGACSVDLPLDWAPSECSLSQTIALAAVTEDTADLGLGEVTRVPVYRLPPLEADRSAPQRGTEVDPPARPGAGRIHLRDPPPAPEDLTVDLRLADGPTGLSIVIQVRDDRIVVGRGFAPLQDGVELFFDLRPDGERGLPFFDERCLILFAQPRGAGVRWSGLGDSPLALEGLEGKTEWWRGGYRLRLTVPWEGLERAAGGAIERFGFDVAVDDNDGGGREAQWVWGGDAGNYVSPARYPVLSRADGSARHEVRGFLWTAGGGSAPW